jgi:hypothetical protein
MSGHQKRGENESMRALAEQHFAEIKPQKAGSREKTGQAVTAGGPGLQYDYLVCFRKELDEQMRLSLRNWTRRTDEGEAWKKRECRQHPLTCTACVCVRACACVRACVRACVCVCVCVCACVHLPFTPREHTHELMLVPPSVLCPLSCVLQGK